MSMLVFPSKQFILSHLKMPAMKTLNSLRSETPTYVSGWSSFMPAHVNTDLSGSVCCPLASAARIIQAMPSIPPMAHRCSWGCPDQRSGLQTICDNGWSLVPCQFMDLLLHRLIERRLYHPYCWTGYAGFSIQSHFLNLVLAVLSLNSLCQFIFCINNLLSQEVTCFGVFYRLFCCLDHVFNTFL